ncbi:hypothetical protein ACIQAC_21150 [Streptomyces sp. NPDC088387]|uniref:hypothetical protein n=1 Tax=Streptomyces sp. NPDC088387 TaxID=3365859 RepID=UPI00380560AA
MAVSLGTRISGLLVAGTVAVVAVAFAGPGPDADGHWNGRSVPGTAGPSAGAVGGTVTPGPTSPVPPLLSLPAGNATGTVGSVPPTDAPRKPWRAPDAAPSSPTAPVGDLPWLPPGPGSSDADHVPDPASVYDVLVDPGQCAAGLAAVPAAAADPDWQVMKGLASACLAVQGRGGDWDTASAAYAAAVGKVGSCKGRAALTVLEGLLDFRRAHPGKRARLAADPDAKPACVLEIASVDAGGADVRPGDAVRIELRGTHFDAAELALGAQVLIDGVPVAVPPLAVPGAGAVLSVVVPELAGYPRTVGVSVRYGDVEASLAEAFTVVAPGPVSSPGTEDPGTGPGPGPGTGPGAGDPGGEEPISLDPVEGAPAPPPGDPGTDTPGADEPGVPEPGTDTPGAPESGTPGPGADEPGVPESGTDEPGVPGSGAPVPGAPEAGNSEVGGSFVGEGCWTHPGARGTARTATTVG